MPVKEDLLRSLPGYAARKGRFDVVNLPARRYLMIDGHGDPNTSQAYADALATLYPMAYRLKFLSRAAGYDYRVMPLEALWWADDLAAFTAARDKSAWKWTVLNLVPDWILGEQVEQALAGVRDAGKAPVPERLRVESFTEGMAVQTLHVGSYDDEGPVLERLHHEVIPAHGLRLAGRHHEIYLNDARRTAPQRLRTILRQPVVG